MSLHQQSCTLCLGLDAKTLEQVKWSHQTWMKNCPELFRLPWVIFYDDQHLTDDMILDTLPCPSPTLMIPWNTAPYGSQREAMLTGFCFVPPMAVRTDYWMKLDTDSVCLVKNPNWFDDRWFDRDEGEATNAYVASSWSYTKAKGDDRSGAEWAEALEVFGDAAYPQHPRLGLAEQVDGQRIRHRRDGQLDQLLPTLRGRKAWLRISTGSEARSCQCRAKIRCTGMRLLGAAVAM